MKRQIASVAAAFAALSAAAFPQDQLVAAGSAWKYLDDGSNQGTAWYAPGFDDTGWASGPAQLGYGDGDESTLVGFGPDPNNKFTTTYFRQTFIVANPGSYVSLRLSLLRDDGAVAYLNGVEVARSAMSSKAPSYTEFAAKTCSNIAEDRFHDYWFDPTALVAGSNVLAVEVHQRTLTSSDLSLDAALFGNPAPSLTRGPYLQMGSDTAITVRWRTDVPTDSRVLYGPSPGNLSQSQVVAGTRTEHEVELTGLSADSTYYYAIGSTTTLWAGGDNDHFFETSPPVGSAQPTRIWVIGDAGTVRDEQEDVRDAYYAFTGAQHTDLWLMLGDNAYNFGQDDEYQFAVFEVYQEMLRKSVVWPTRGNHEMSAGVHYGNFTLPDAAQAGGVVSGTEAYWSFDYANAHFICLDSFGSDRSVGGAMYNWLQADLAATAQEWIIAYWHHPPYTKGSHNSNLETILIEMRQNFVPLLESGGVDLVLSGHSHSYERSFLLDGHYGKGGTLTPQMLVDDGDGRESGDGAYDKAAGPNAGAVYAVAGSSGKVSSGEVLNLNAHFIGVEVLGSVVIDIDGGRLDLTFVSDLGQTVDWFTMLSPSYSGTYCLAKVSSSGCIPAMGSSGTPSVTDPNPFLATASGVETTKTGLLFYGYAPLNAPFQGGSKCVAAPTKRTGLQDSGGAGLCGGSYSYDFNARIQSGIDPGLVLGATVYSQYWYRDPGSGSTTGLSDALQFVIEP
jgi:hypothetical protein